MSWDAAALASRTHSTGGTLICMTSVVIYDDARGELGALADLRPVFDVRTGCLTTRQRLARAFGVSDPILHVPEALFTLASESLGHPASVNRPITNDIITLVNGRCVLPPDSLNSLPPGSALLEPNTNDLIAAQLPREDAQQFLSDFELPDRMNSVIADGPCLLHRPWDVIRFRDEAVRRDLASIVSAAPPHGRAVPDGVFHAGSHPVVISASATISPGVFLDSEKGAIVIEDGVRIRPGVVLVGPLFIGADSTILEHAFIKANTAIGPRCKVAGEVGGTIMQGHSNKGHDGHLGDSWIGEWVNLGAGTINSNLLNTYGEVAAALSPGALREKTGLTFLGCILGDHVKTAIGTHLMTGTIIGTGAMIARTAPPPTAVNRFAWLTDEGQSTWRLPGFFDSAERMMSRRSAVLSDAMRARLTALHRHTVSGPNGGASVSAE